ncbi:hypothetical protein [Actinoplanes nipponensis]|nr:hypothetical protein [Actinoplanes nipponensis]
MRNNISHYGRERRRLRQRYEPRPLPPETGRALAALRRHILRQNYLAAAALVPLGVFLLFSEITGFDEKGIRQLLRVE